MKAIVLHEYGGPSKLLYEDWDDPTPGEGEVLVMTAATSVNPIDYKMRSGAAQDRFPLELPAIIGRDLSGVVRAVGPGVTGVEPGDKIIALTNRAYAQLVVVKLTELTRLPAGMDIVKSAALPLVTLTGEQLIRRAAKPEKGQTILITGANGGVGRSAVRAAKEDGAIVIAGVRKKQMEAAKEIGADEYLALDDEDAIAKLGLLDAIADTIGGKLAETFIAKVKPGGVYASVVGPPANAKLHPTVRIEAFMAQPDSESLGRLAALVQAGRLHIPIDRMVALEDAAEAHAAAEKGGLGKILLLA